MTPKGQEELVNIFDSVPEESRAKVFWGLVIEEVGKLDKSIEYLNAIAKAYGQEGESVVFINMLTHLWSHKASQVFGINAPGFKESIEEKLKAAFDEWAYYTPELLQAWKELNS
jgi:hypothetical protein